MPEAVDVRTYDWPYNWVQDTAFYDFFQEWVVREGWPMTPATPESSGTLEFPQTHPWARYDVNQLEQILVYYYIRHTQPYRA